MMNTDSNNKVGAWLQEPTCRVLDVALAAVEAEEAALGNNDLATMLAASPPYRDASAGVRTMSVHLPLLVHAAITDDVERAIPLAAALLLLEAGIYALDHMMDGELAPPLDGWTTGSVVLAATGLVSYIPQKLLADIDCAAAIRVDLFRLLANGMSGMRRGQLIDLATKYDATPTPAAIDAAIRGKTGERRAMYAAMGALLCGADPGLVDTYWEYACALGAARQINSDLIDLFADGKSRDLASGVRTLPLALYFDQASQADSDAMLELLDRARDGSGATQADICALLRSSGALRQTLLRKEVQCQRALRHLDAARPSQAANDELRAAVYALSLSRRS